MISSAVVGTTKQFDGGLDDDFLITVAICTRNRAHFLAKAVESVLKQIIPGVEILVIDNGSTDGTRDLARRMEGTHPIVRYVHESQVGLSAARNTALRRARGRYVLFLDDDAIAAAGWLAAYVDFLSRLPNRRVACVGGPVYPLFETEPPRWWLPTSGILDLGTPKRELHTESGPWGGNIAYDKQAALQAGGFNTDLGRKGNFRGAHEECELNQRLKSKGLQIWWLPEAGIKHFTPSKRFRLRFLIENEVAEGRSAALVRLGNQKPGLQSAAYQSIRLVAAPFHFLINMLVSILVLPFQHGRMGVKFLLRAARIWGFFCEMAIQFGGSFVWSSAEAETKAARAPARAESHATAMKTALPQNEKV